jgi:hypothetical protein
MSTPTREQVETARAKDIALREELQLAHDVALREQKTLAASQRKLARKALDDSAADAKLGKIECDIVAATARAATIALKLDALSERIAEHDAVLAAIERREKLQAAREVRARVMATAAAVDAAIEALRDAATAHQQETDALRELTDALGLRGFTRVNEPLRLKQRIAMGVHAELWGEVPHERFMDADYSVPLTEMFEDFQLPGDEPAKERNAA